VQHLKQEVEHGRWSSYLMMLTSSTLNQLGSVLKKTEWPMRSLLEKRFHGETRFLKADHLCPFLISCFHLLRAKAVIDLVYLI